MDLPPKHEMLELYSGQSSQSENNSSNRFMRNNEDLSNQRIPLYDDPNDKRNKYGGNSNNDFQGIIDINFFYKCY